MDFSDPFARPKEHPLLRDLVRAVRADDADALRDALASLPGDDERRAAASLDVPRRPLEEVEFIEPSVTLLGEAARLGHTGAMAVLVEAGADVNESAGGPGRRSVYPPLLSAAGRGHAGAVRMLLAAGAEPSVSESAALRYAAASGHHDVVRALADAGAERAAFYSLVCAGVAGRLPELRALIAAGADLEERTPFDRSALQLVAEKGPAAAVEVLLAAGADVNAAGRDGTTALHAAARRGDPRVIDVLVGRGADLERTDGQGRTAVQCASYHNSADAVRALAAAGASVTAQTAGAPCGAMEVAVVEGSCDAAEALAGLGAPVDGASRWSRPLLHEAVLEHELDMVVLLVRLGAPLNAECALGRTALCTAARLGQDDTVDALLALGAAPTAPDGVTDAVAKWRAGEHPLQRERAELERALLSLYGDTFPAEMARLCGTYVHLGARRG